MTRAAREKPPEPPRTGFLTFSGYDKDPAASPDGRFVAFVSQRDGRSRIWLEQLATGDEVALTAGEDTAPRFSPDSSELLFARAEGLRSSLYRVSLMGGEPRKMIENALSGDWSPDGSRIAFTRASERGQRLGSVLAVANTDGSGERVVSGERLTLLWLPNLVAGLDLLASGEIVFDAISLRQNLRELTLYPSSLAAEEWVTRGNSVDRQPIYSPDGEWIAFSSTRSGNIDIWQVHRKTKSVRRLTSDPADDWDPGFTRDGKSLLFSSNRGGHFEIWLADADGRRARQLTRDGVDAENATATPDGEWIVYASGNPEKRGLWKIRNDGSQPVHLLAAPALHPEVSPDGSLVLYHTLADPGWTELRVIRMEDGAPVDFRIRIELPGGQISADLMMSPASLGRARWMPDGRAIPFVAVDEKNRSGVMVQDFVPGRETSATRRRLAGFGQEGNAESLGISPDGSRLSISGIEVSPGLMIVQGPPGLERTRILEREER
ncbi:MAG: hypothetical protein ABR576_04290 [Thermoanaerobaculia bacterium]